MPGLAQRRSPSKEHSLPVASVSTWAPAPSASADLEPAHGVVSMPAGPCLQPIRMQGNYTVITGVCFDFLMVHVFRQNGLYSESRGLGKLQGPEG